MEGTSRFYHNDGIKKKDEVIREATPVSAQQVFEIASDSIHIKNAIILTENHKISKETLKRILKPGAVK